jgi:YD repeat-containing protein
VVLDSGNGSADVIDTNPADGASYRTVVAKIGLGGSGNSSSYSPFGVAVGADGGFAYVGISGSSTSGVAVLQFASTSTGFTFVADDMSLSQGSTSMSAPNTLAVDPNGETLYVAGVDTLSQAWAFAFPIATSGQVSSGSGSAVSLAGLYANGAAFSPEDSSLFADSASDMQLVAVDMASGTKRYDTTTANDPGVVAVSPDGLYVAEANLKHCGTIGSTSVGLFDAATGTSLATVTTTGAVVGLAYAPQTSPQQVATSELAGGASNPSESAVTSGMNDVVSSGTPSDAPGASAGVDTATGAYSLSIDSMTVPDLGIPLDQSATYDSSRAATNNLLGYGWQSSYGITATQNAHNAATNPCAITFTQEDGATVTFFPSAQGPFPTTCPTSGYQARGWAQATLTFQASCVGTDTCWVLQRGAATKYFVDSTNGELVKEQDLNGNTVTITWGTHTGRCAGVTSTEPCDVTAADATRILAFSYPSAGSGTCPSGTVTCIVVTDPLGRMLTYVKNSTGDLTTITLSNGAETASYALTYGSGHLLASWWDPQNNASHAGNTSFATDVTYTSGRVTQVTGPEIYSAAPLSTTAITPTTTFSYATYDAGTGDGTVLVKNPDFNQSNSEPGASQTLDTYADFELVSSVVGYGPAAAYGSSPTVAPNPTESAYPMRDGFNLMPSIAMNALAGTTESSIGETSSGGTVYKGAGSQDPTYDNGVVFTTYDASGNALSATDELGNTTTSTYNALNEVVSTTDAMGNQTVNTYNATGQLLTTTSPATNAGGAAPKTSSWLNANGTVCASRDAIQTATYGVLSSCVTAGSNATCPESSFLDTLGRE